MEQDVKAMHKEISRLQSEIKKLERENKQREQCEEGAAMLGTMKTLLMENGFTEEQAFRLLLTVLQTIN